MSLFSLKTGGINSLTKHPSSCISSYFQAIAHLRATTITFLSHLLSKSLRRMNLLETIKPLCCR